MMIIGQNLGQEVDLQGLWRRSVQLTSSVIVAPENDGVLGNDLLRLNMTSRTDNTAVRQFSGSADEALRFQDVIVADL